MSVLVFPKPKAHHIISVCRSTGVEGFYIGVQSSIEEYHTPKAFFTLHAETFVKTVPEMEPKALALKLEAFVTTGLADQDKCTYLFSSDFIT